jgi:hypothetical protein
MYPCDIYWHGSTSSFCLSTQSTWVDCLLSLLCPGTCHLTLTQQTPLSIYKKKITSYIYITSKFSVSWICLNSLLQWVLGGVFLNLLYTLYSSQSFHWLYPSLLRYTPLNWPACKKTRSAIHCAGSDAVSPRQFPLWWHNKFFWKL